jgi:hypothetical protein
LGGGVRRPKVKERDGTRRSRARFRRGQGVRGSMTGGPMRRGSSRFRGAPALGLAGIFCLRSSSSLPQAYRCSLLFVIDAI